MIPGWARIVELRPSRVTLGVLLLITGLAFAGSLGNSLFGSDTWPWLVSSQVHSPGEALRLAFSPIMPGTRFSAEVALFYHPVTALSYALDLAVFGVNPVALYATNVVIHLCAVGALFSLARALGLALWSSAACALTLALHPIASATVPSLPRRQDLLVGALLLASMSLLARSRLGATQPRWSALSASIVLYLFALGGKEVAYAALVAVPLVIVCSWRTDTCWAGDTRRRLARAVGVCLVFLAVESIAFAIRWHVLGGLGGYYGSENVRGRLDGIVEYFVRPYVTDVLWPFQALMPDRLRDWLLAVLVAFGVVGVGAASVGRYLRLVVLLGVVWQLAFLALYVGVHTSLSAYLLYVPLAGLALIVGAMLEGGVSGLQPPNALRRRGRLTRGRDLVVRACALVAAAGMAALLVGIVRGSALLSPPGEFRDAGFVSDQFLAAALPCLAATPEGGTLEVNDLPHRIDYGTPQSHFIDAFVFEPYSLDDAVRLLAPSTHVSIDVAGLQDVGHRPARVESTCLPGPDRWRMSVRIEG